MTSVLTRVGPLAGAGIAAVLYDFVARSRAAAAALDDACTPTGAGGS